MIWATRLRKFSLLSVVVAGISACTGDIGSLSQAQLASTYNWAAGDWINRFATTGYPNDTQLRPGEFFAKVLPVDGNQTGEWRKVGDIVTCGNTLCMNRLSNGQRERFVQMRDRSGRFSGYERQIANSDRGRLPRYDIYNGHALIVGTPGNYTIAAWRQDVTQIQRANSYYRAISGYVLQAHQNAANRIADQNFSSGMQGVNNAMTAMAGAMSVPQQQQAARVQQQRSLDQARQRENEARQRQIEQANADRRLEEQRIAAERNRQQETQRQTAERQRLEALRQSQPGGSGTSGAPRPTCIPREIGCSGGVNDCGIYTGLPPCRN